MDSYSLRDIMAFLHHLPQFQNADENGVVIPDLSEHFVNSRNRRSAYEDPDDHYVDHEDEE